MVRKVRRPPVTALQYSGVPSTLHYYRVPSTLHYYRVPSTLHYECPPGLTRTHARPEAPPHAPVQPYER